MKGSYRSAFVCSKVRVTNDQLWLERSSGWDGRRDKEDKGTSGSGLKEKSGVCNLVQLIMRIVLE